MIIAIDGPAASGKGTLAKRLAAHFKLPHLDTGLLYRATARGLLDAGEMLGDCVAAARMARGLDLTRFDEAALRGQAMGEAASVVAAFPEVRAALVGVQRDFAARGEGAVLDGRDIGTVICPHADIKFFVTAAAQTRAQRRTREFAALGIADDPADVLADILARDARDANRADAPLRPAEDAHRLDTTQLDADAAFEAARAIIDGKLAERKSG